SKEPGVFFFRFLRRDAEGVPGLGARTRLKVSGGEKGSPAAGAVVQTQEGTVYGYWLVKGGLQKTKLDPAQAEFAPVGKPMVITGLPRGPREVLAYENADGSVSVVFSVSDGTPYRRKDGPGHRDPEYHP